MPAYVTGQITLSAHRQAEIGTAQAEEAPEVDEAPEAGAEPTADDEGVDLGPEGDVSPELNAEDGENERDAGVDEASGSASVGGSPTAGAVAIDVKRRTTTRPKAFGVTKLVRVTAVAWTTWGSPTTTGRGRVIAKKKGRNGRAVRASGTVVLSGLRPCPDGTPLYRRATVRAAGRKVVSVALPGCSALR